MNFNPIRKVVEMIQRSSNVVHNDKLIEPCIDRGSTVRSILEETYKNKINTNKFKCVYINDEKFIYVYWCYGFDPNVPGKKKYFILDLRWRIKKCSSGRFGYSCFEKCSVVYDYNHIHQYVDSIKSVFGDAKEKTRNHLPVQKISIQDLREIVNSHVYVGVNPKVLYEKKETNLKERFKNILLLVKMFHNKQKSFVHSFFSGLTKSEFFVFQSLIKTRFKNVLNKLTDDGLWMISYRTIVYITQYVIDKVSMFVKNHIKSVRTYHDMIKLIGSMSVYLQSD